MNLYAEYIREREGKFVLEKGDGFAIYFFLDWGGQKAVYIQEIFVSKDARGEGVASKMADEIADIAMTDYSATLMIGSVCPGTRGDTASLKVLLAYGFELDSINGNLIMFKKRLED